MSLPQQVWHGTGLGKVAEFQWTTSSFQQPKTKETSLLPKEIINFPMVVLFDNLSSHRPSCHFPMGAQGAKLRETPTIRRPEYFRGPMASDAYSRTMAFELQNCQKQ